MKKTLPPQQLLSINTITNLRFFTKSIILLFFVLSLNSYGFNSFFKCKKTNSLSMFRVQMSGSPNYLDECVIYYQEGATNGFDSGYDSYKLFGSNPAPHISIDNDTLLLDINGIPPVIQTYTTLILATTPITGNYTITATDVMGLPAGTCIFLKDLQTNTSVNLLLSPYSFNLSNTTTTSRFLLTITFNTLPIISTLNQPACKTPNSGMFKLSGNSNGPWNYTWKDTLGTILKTSLGLNTGDSLSNLSNGGYHVEIASVSNACLRNEINFNISEVIMPTALFSSVDTISLGLITGFTPTNQSLNCTSYKWDFGDGIGSSFSFQPTYVYAASGIYHVKFVGKSITGCEDSIVKPITVTGITTSIKETSNQNIRFINTGSNHFQIKLLSSSINELQIDVYDLNGKNQLTEKKENLKGMDNVFLNFDYLTQGIYTLTIKNTNANILVTKFIIN